MRSVYTLHDQHAVARFLTCLIDPNSYHPYFIGSEKILAREIHHDPIIIDLTLKFDRPE